MRKGYNCQDGKRVEVPRRTASVRDLNEIKTVPRNMITYTVSEEHVRATVSGVELSRNMRCIFGGSDSIRTMIFSTIIRSVR